MTFDDFLREIDLLARAIQQASFTPDYLVGLARGGWIPTRLLSSRLRVREILSVGMKYADTARTRLVTYSKPDPMPNDARLLLIEDCLESGRSLIAARDLFQNAGNQVRTASVFITQATLEPPDFYNRCLEAPPRFPWE